MSSYYQFTKHPKTGKWEEAFWMDDYYGRHHYGVKFSSDDMYDPWETQLYITISEEEAKILNKETDAVLEFLDCARYDALMEGPKFNNWDRSALERLRQKYESQNANIKQKS